VRSLAEHLNRSGIKPYRGPDKTNHNRSKALIFTGDVLKDLIGSPSYFGKVLVEGELVLKAYTPLWSMSKHGVPARRSRSGTSGAQARPGRSTPIR